METDVQQMVLVKEEAGVNQQDPEPLHIKEELWTSLEGEHLHLEEETDAARFPFTVVSIKNEDDEEKPLFSQLQQQQIEDRDVPNSSSADQMTAETGGGAETSRNPDLNPHEQTSDSSETEVSGDDEEDDDVNLGSELSDSRPESGDRDDDWKKSRSSESDVDICKSNWKALRDGYVKKHKKVLLPSSSAGGTQRDWKYTDIMSFLLPFGQPRSSRSNFRSTAVDSGGSSCSPSGSCSIPGPASDNYSSSDDGEILRPRSPRERHPTPSVPGRRAAGKSSKTQREAINDRLMDLLKEPPPKPLMPRDETEEAYFFAVSIVPTLARLNRERLLQAKLDILKVLGEHEAQQSREVHGQPHQQPFVTLRRMHQAAPMQMGATSYQVDEWDQRTYEEL